MEKPIRVIQYGVGWIGAAIVRLMLEKPGLQVVGAVDAGQVEGHHGQRWIERDCGRSVE